MAKGNKNSNSNTIVITGQTGGRAPRAVWAMEQASMGRRKPLKGKAANTDSRREGKSQCDSRAW